MGTLGFDRIEFSIGGFFDGFCDLLIEKDDAGSLEWRAGRHSRWPLGREQSSGSVTQGRADALLERINGAGVVGWYRFYCDPTVLDGASWSLRISREGHIAFESEGINAFPDGFNALIEALCECGLPRFVAGPYCENDWSSGGSGNGYLHLSMYADGGDAGDDDDALSQMPYVYLRFSQFERDLVRFIGENELFTGYEEILRKNGIKCAADVTDDVLTGLDAECIVAMVVATFRADFGDGRILGEAAENGTLTKWLEQLSRAALEGD